MDIARFPLWTPECPERCWFTNAEGNRVYPLGVTFYRGFILHRWPFSSQEDSNICATPYGDLAGVPLLLPRIPCDQHHEFILDGKRVETRCTFNTSGSVIRARVDGLWKPWDDAVAVLEQAQTAPPDPMAWYPHVRRPA